MPRGKKQTETDTSFNPEEFDRTPPATVQEAGFTFFESAGQEKRWKGAEHQTGKFRLAARTVKVA